MESVKEIFVQHSQLIFQIVLSAVTILLAILSRNFSQWYIARHANNFGFVKEREEYVKKLVKIVVWTLFLLVLGMIWEVSLKGVSIYFASLFTVIGVALFANWSVLSNMTSSVILFFFYPYKVGHYIKFLDGDNSVEGKIVDVTLFYIKIEKEDGQLFCYPNNIAIQKATQYTS